MMWADDWASRGACRTSDPDTLFVAAFLGMPRTTLLEAAVYAEDGRVVLDRTMQAVRQGRACHSTPPLRTTTGRWDRVRHTPSGVVAGRLLVDWLIRSLLPDTLRAAGMRVGA